MKKQGIILLGGGGHCHAVIDVIEAENKYEILGILDLKEKVGERVLGYEIIGTDADIEKWNKKGCSFHVSFGQIKNAIVRKSLYAQLKSIRAQLPVIFSPLAYVSKHADVEEGTIIMHHAVVNAGVTIGVNCIINNKALIEHDVTIGDHCHIATSAVVNGNSHVGEACFVGSRSVLIQGIKVGKDCVIGAGSVLIQNYPAGVTIAGNPGKIIRKK